MGVLSEKIEAKITGKPAPEVSVGEMFLDLIRGLRIAIRNIIREVLYTLTITLLGLLIPGLGQVVSGGLIFMIQAYYAGFGNADFTLERRRYKVNDSVRFMRQNRALALGNGAGFLLLLLIPVAGLVLAPGLGAVAATIDSVEAIDQTSYRSRLRA